MGAGFKSIGAESHGTSNGGDDAALTNTAFIIDKNTLSRVKKYKKVRLKVSREHLWLYPGICMHFDSMREVIPFMNGCEDYLKTEDSWAHLRLYRQCGRIGCCDSSKKTRDQALSRDRLSDHVALRSLRPVGLVLQRRRDVRFHRQPDQAPPGFIGCFEDRKLR